MYTRRTNTLPHPGTSPPRGFSLIELAEDVVEQFGTGSWGDDGYIVYTNSNYTLSRVPGTGGVPEEIATAVREMGLPVLLKAVGGGGGRGQRLVKSEDTLAADIEGTMHFGGRARGDADGNYYLEGLDGFMWNDSLSESMSINTWVDQQ